MLLGTLCPFCAHSVPTLCPKPKEMTSIFEYYLTALVQSLELEPPTLFNILKPLRLVSLGRSYEQAGTSNWLEPAVIATLEEMFSNASHKMKFNERGVKKSIISGAEKSTAIIEYISDDAVKLIQ